MNFWATQRPSHWAKYACAGFAMVCASLLLSCGGGGSGGNGGGTRSPCGRPLGSTPPALCGRVVSGFASTSNLGVSGAIVILRDTAGVELSRTTTDQNGNFIFTSIAPGAALFQVEQPPSGGYYQNVIDYAGATYDYTKTASTGGPCYPSIGGLPTSDKSLGNIGLFPDTGVPYPPAFGCPR
jgi:hypothetical protein